VGGVEHERECGTALGYMLASLQGGSAWAADWLGGDKTSVVLASECMSGD
jgi:hypothetical protein